MRYLLLCCIEENHWNSIGERERAGIMQEYGAWAQRLDQTGQHVASAQLQPTATAATVRAKGGKPVVSDGPFAETKEQIGGYHLIDCAGLDEALSIAADIPTLRVGGTIEVRPLVSESPIAGNA